MNREIIDNISHVDDVKQTCLDCDGYFRRAGLLDYCDCNYHYHGHARWRINPFSLPQFHYVKENGKWVEKYIVG